MALNYDYPDRVAAVALPIGFGMLFIGRMLLYPVTLVPGTFFQRLSIQSSFWEIGHLLMIAGMLAIVPGLWGLSYATARVAPRLTPVAFALVSTGAMLFVGQYALDYAMLAAAQLDSSVHAERFAQRLRGQPIVEWVFYKLPDVSQVGLILFTITVWQLGSCWRIPATILTVAAVTSIAGPPLVGPWGIRAALFLWFIGFALTGWKLSRQGTHHAES